MTPGTDGNAESFLVSACPGTGEKAELLAATRAGKRALRFDFGGLNQTNGQ